MPHTVQNKEFQGIRINKKTTPHPPPPPPLGNFSQIFPFVLVTPPPTPSECKRSKVIVTNLPTFRVLLREPKEMYC